ncbi:hypothetical protein PSEUDO8O_120584 [Pseudomonas sp. 8O]|nr:hypothetical protein PSEUDO8O_120584 [Pseudomonas sp. 8O]
MVRLLPKACRRASPVPTIRRPATSRRQYLSRMDRFQHGRSGADFKTMRPSDQPEITPNFISFRISHKTS